jgi:Phosphoenolpyruvate phosphomutase
MNQKDRLSGTPRARTFAPLTTYRFRSFPEMRVGKGKSDIQFFDSTEYEWLYALMTKTGFEGVQTKKCGHTPVRRVVPVEQAVRKIKVAVESRSSTDFLVLARTDARTTLGLDEALRRGEAFAKAGADILFIESPESRRRSHSCLDRGAA